MVPYLRVPPLQLGPLELPVLTFFAVLATVVGALTISRLAAARGLDRAVTLRSLLWVLAGVLLGAHLVSVTLYFPHWIARDPWVLLRLWEGMSSFGGIFGGLVAGALFFWHRGLSPTPFAAPYLEGGLRALALGRVGCALEHDHPGRITDFALAVRGWPAVGLRDSRPAGVYTEGLTRHDLGLDELLLLIALILVARALRGVSPIEHLSVIVVLALYGICRFLLDFLRTADPRYGALTPGQWFSLALLAGALALLFRGVWRKGRACPANQ